MSRRVLPVIVFVLTAQACVWGQVTEPPAQKKAQKVAAPGAKTAQKAALLPAKRPLVTRTVETQLSGFSSQDADQLYARLALQETRAERSWYVRGALSRTVTKNGSTSSVVTSKLDSRLEHATSPKSYSVWTGVLSRRARD